MVMTYAHHAYYLKAEHLFPQTYNAISNQTFQNNIFQHHLIHHAYQQYSKILSFINITQVFLRWDACSKQTSLLKKICMCCNEFCTYYFALLLSKLLVSIEKFAFIFLKYSHIRIFTSQFLKSRYIEHKLNLWILITNWTIFKLVIVTFYRKFSNFYYR